MHVETKKERINDGSGPLVDFQTFDFTGQWNRLTRLGISARGGAFGDYTTLAIDNLVFRTVPEPGTLSLFAAGLLALGLMRRKFAA